MMTGSPFAVMNSNDIKKDETAAVIKRRGRPRKTVTNVDGQIPVLDNSMIIENMLDVGENGPFICNLCQPQKCFKNSTGLRNHVGWKHSTMLRPAQREAKGGYKCDICAMAIRGYAALTMHKLKKHGVEQLHQCDKCDKMFAKLRSLHKHMAEEHGIQMFKCDICKVQFKSREGWRMHKKKTHLIDEPTQVCYLCGKSFKMPYQLKNHIKLTHKTIRDFSCHLCSRAFKGCQSLRRHLLTYHSDDRSFSCDVCGSKFKTKTDMSSHRKLHFRPINPLPASGNSGQKQMLEDGPYMCRYCSKTFSKMLRCKAHEKLIHETKESGVRFVCLPCDKVFQNQYYLIHHVNNKHRQRNHRCPHCDRLYSQAYLLRRHLGRCTQSVILKPYSCSNCSLKFTTKNNLLKHMQCPSRCRRNEVVDCVILVSDGTGSLSFEGDLQCVQQPPLLEIANESQSILNSDDVHQIGTDHAIQLSGENHLDVMKEEHVVTVDESSIPVSAEELCVMVIDMDEIAVKDEDFAEQKNVEHFALHAAQASEVL